MGRYTNSASFTFLILYERQLRRLKVDGRESVRKVRLSPESHEKMALGSLKSLLMFKESIMPSGCLHLWLATGRACGLKISVVAPSVERLRGEGRYDVFAG